MLTFRAGLSLGERLGAEAVSSCTHAEGGRALVLKEFFAVWAGSGHLLHGCLLTRLKRHPLLFQLCLMHRAAILSCLRWECRHF